jgi:hypothetical protein
VDVDVGEEQVHAVQSDVVGHADEAHVPAGAGRVDGLPHRLLGADGLDHRVRPVAAGEVLDCRDALVATLFHNVGGTELAGQLLPVGVPRHGDDPFRTQLAGGQDAEQSDRSVADDGDGLTRSGLGGDGGEPAGAEDIGGG